jgi:hypothetical protein
MVDSKVRSARWPPDGGYAAGSSGSEISIRRWQRAEKQSPRYGAFEFRVSDLGLLAGWRLPRINSSLAQLP